MNEEQLFFTLALQNAEGVGNVIAKKLLACFDDAQAVLKASTSDLIRIDGIGDRLLMSLRDKDIYLKAEKELATLQKHGIISVYYQNDDYPVLLKHCDDGPVLLFSNQILNWENPRIISIVGTRNYTRQGRDFCENLIADLASYNPIIVSGFAYGIDITAHKAAVQHQLMTVAVLGHGLLEVYPRQHKKYIDLLKTSGGFLTEFKTGSVIDKENFIRRNRIVAGISEATIVIESGIKGGSMSTARFANEYNREVFAVPGRTTDTYSQGCNDLIKFQKAQLITSAQDVVSNLGWDRQLKKETTIQKKLFVMLTDEEQKIYDYLRQTGKQSLDDIAVSCEMAVYKVSSLLLGMELKGVLRPLPGKIFEVL